MKKIVFILSFICIVYSGNTQLQAQKNNYFVPRELQKAYKNNTRAYDGTPGVNYFQNSADYKIKADFNPETGILKGKETITYHNNSPDTLQKLVIRLYQNIFKRGVKRDFNIGKKDLHSGTRIKKLQLNGREYDVNSLAIRMQGTIMTIHPDKAILPNTASTLKIHWELQMPEKTNIRYGKYGDNNWFVAYWYPQISVYDDVSGWDTHPFTGSAEFYNDYNNYDVTIKLPGNYLLWATGHHNNPKDIYTQNIRDRINKARKSDTVVKIVSGKDIRNNRVLKDTSRKKWHFTANQVPDFAFALSNSYVWDGTSAQAKPGKRVFVSAVYEPETNHFAEVADISRKTIEHFSDKTFGVPFPWEKLTVFNGSGGMEFPMLINDGDPASIEATVGLTAHEIGHNYFPFYVQTNESYYAFMDEGLITFLPQITEKHILDSVDIMNATIRKFSNSAGNSKEVPLMTKSYMINDYPTYRLHAYVRPANAFYFLRKMLGKDDFHKALKTFIERWAKKNPTPYDLFNTFEDVLNKNLDWYWNPWFFEFGYPDLAIKNVTQKAGTYNVKIEQNGNVPVPLRLKVTHTGGTIKKYREPTHIWKNNRYYTIEIPAKESIQKIAIDTDAIPDIFPKNNTYTIE